MTFGLLLSNKSSRKSTNILIEEFSSPTTTEYEKDEKRFENRNL